MKKLLLLVPLCISINAFASHVTNSDSVYYHVCTTSDGGKTWDDGGTVHPSSDIQYNAAADAVAIGRIGDCNYTGSSWTNHAGDVISTDWQWNGGDVFTEEMNANAAMIFWQRDANTHIEESWPNYGLDSVCLYDNLVFDKDVANCWATPPK